ncbi:MAG TPA: hypothetical protein DCM68_08530 [Verrucomicrobia bacterium]|nr:hypothetical protein [Verrucomicrobiota bacterium]
MAAVFGPRIVWAPEPGEMRIYPETVLQIALAPVPEIEEAPAPEPKVGPPPEPVPVPEPAPEPESEPEVVPEPEPEPKPEPPPPPVLEAAPSEAEQPVAEIEGDSGEEEALRAEWLGELRRRIEESKFYPGAARYSREAGTVLLRVEIGADGKIGPAEVLENTGSALLAEGARGILRRAASRPLGTNRMPEGFEVDVPITYRIDR